MTIFIGIDPGLDGALATIGGAFGPKVVDTPTLTVKGTSGARREYAVQTMAALVQALHGVSGDAFAVIEHVHAMPGQGVRSMFTMGLGVGVWLGLLAANRIAFERVTPQRWKKLMLDGQGKEKDAARFKAASLFPDVELHLKKHSGRADAILIAEYGRRTYSGRA